MSDNEDLYFTFDLGENDSINADFDLEQSSVDANFNIYAGGTTWGSILGTLSNQTDLQNALDAKQDVLTAGTGISIENDVISCTQSAAVWGNITGTLSNQTDLKDALDTLQGQITADHEEIGHLGQTIGTDGDIVTYNASDFATSIQGGLADTALQPGDNISELVNNSGYITSSALNGYATETWVNNKGYITGITSSDVTTALGYTPYDASNPAGYITSAALPTDYVTTNTAQTISASKAFSQPLVIADNNGLASGTILSNKKILQRSNGDNTLTLNNIDNKLRLVGSETRPKYSADGTNFTDLALSTDITTYSAGTGIDITSGTVSVTSPTVIDNATGTHSIAIGDSSQSTAEGSVAVGDGSKANSTYSTVVGYNAQASNTNSVAIGKQAKATAARTVAIGSGAEANANDAYVIKGVNNTANTFQVGSYTLLDTSTGLIPDARINSSTYATKTYVNDSISTNTAYFDGSWATYADIPATVAGFTNENLPEPTNNNYLVVLEDETQDGGTWRYKYIDDGNGYAKANWAVEYEVNETPLTQAQLDALNSGITSGDVTLIGTALQPNDNVSDLVNDSGYITGITSSDVTTALGYTPYSNSNPSGYITGITSGDVTTALGYTPYDSSNPNGYTSNVGTVTSVNNVSPVSGNVTLPIPTVNDATLTITQGGVTKGTFTANASSNVTIDLDAGGGGTPANMVTTDTNQDITGTKTFIGQKKIAFKQSSSSDELGFTLYDSSSSELGALELRPNTISSSSLLSLNNPVANSSYVGFRYWGTPAVNIVAPKVTTAGDYFIPVNVTDGTNTVTADHTGTLNISTLIPTNVSSFTNDAGYLTAITSSNILDALSAGSGISFTQTGQITLDPYSLTAANTWTEYSGDSTSASGSSGDFGYYPHFRLCEGIDLASDTWSIEIPIAYKSNGNVGFGIGYTCATSAWNSNISDLLFNIYSRDNTSVSFTAGNSTSTRYKLNLSSGYTGFKIKLTHESSGGTWKLYAKEDTANDYTLLGTVTYTLLDNASLYLGVTGVGSGTANGRVNSIRFSDIIIKSPASEQIVVAADSTIQRALGYTPVNKAGDTMSGALTVSGDMTATGQYYKKYPSTVSKGTNPSSNANSIYAIIDGDSSHTTWQSNRLGGVAHTLSTTGESSTVLMAYKNETNSTVNAQIKVGIYADGTTYCTFPNTTCVDGQWVVSSSNLASSVSLAIGNDQTLEYDLSSYLPSDSYKYEVLISVNAQTGNSSGAGLNMSLSGKGSSNGSDLWYRICDTYARGSWYMNIGNNAVVPIGTDRKLVLHYTVVSKVATLNNMYVEGYRRIGTNS